MTTRTIAATVDTVAIAVPVDDFDRVGMTHTVDGFGTPAERHRWSRKLDGGGFLATGMGHKAWIEASLPKRADPEGENVEALPIPRALEVLEDLYYEAADHLCVSRGHVFDESKVIRVDFVRDFHDVDDIPIVLDGLARVDQPGRSKVRRFADPARGQAETLRVGPKAWGCTLYDKHAETGGRAPRGQLRFEARTHQDQLTSVWARGHGGHVRVVEDLHERGDALATIQRGWFERAGFDRQVAPRDVIGQLIRTCGESPRVQAMLWSYLTMPGFGADLSSNTRRKYRTMATDAGVTPAWFHADDTVRPVAQVVGLDYDAGTLRVA